MNTLAKYLDAFIGGIIGAIIGTLCAHRLTLWRDRRKEFNEVAQPIRAILLEERDWGGSGDARGLTPLNADQLENVLPWWKKWSFRRAWKAYEKSKENPTINPMGDFDFEEIAGHIDKLLCYTKRR